MRPQVTPTILLELHDERSHKLANANLVAFLQWHPREPVSGGYHPGTKSPSRPRLRNGLDGSRGMK